MSNRISYFLAVLLLLVAAVLRLKDITALPSGLHDGEIVDIRVAETARGGSVEVFYDLGGEGREGLYHIGAVLGTSLIGNGPLGYRLLSVWIGMLALAILYSLGRRILGTMGGLGAMSLLAVSLFPTLLSRQISREAMLPLLVTYILFCLASALPVYKRRRKRGDNTSAAAALGALLGLTLYVHPIGLLTMLFSMLFIAYMIITRQQMSRRRLSYIGFALLLMIILGMPYLISTIRRPELAGVDRLAGKNYPNVSLQAAFDSLAGLVVKGDTNPRYNLPGRPMFDPLSGWIILVGFIAAWADRRHPRRALLLTATLILSPVFLLSGDAPDFINYASALPVLALFFGLGLQTLSELLPRSGATVMSLFLVGITVYNVQWTGRDLLGKWNDLPEVQEAYNGDLGKLALYLDHYADNAQMVVCGWLPEPYRTSSALTDSQLIFLMMNRETARLRPVDCYNALVLTNGGAYQQIIMPRPDVLDTAHPEIRWWLAQAQPVNLSSIPPNTVWSMALESVVADRMGMLTAQPSVSYAPEAGGSRDQLINTPVSFAGNLTFLGYVPDVDSVYKPGETVTLVTYWRVDGRVPPDLQLFAHILADPGASPPANRDIIELSPRMLRNRDVFVQVTYIPLPESLPLGEYMVSIGAYQSSSDARLAVLDNGEPRGTRLFLYPITIE